MKWILLYLPPKGVWYVHSHKLYDSADKARQAASEFLPKGSSFKVIQLDHSCHVIESVL